MKFHLQRPDGRTLISAVSEGAIVIDGERWTQPVLVWPDAAPQPLAASSFEMLATDHFEPLLAARPDVVLLGTGGRQRFAHPQLYAALTAAQIGVDCMDTAAACRTYNVLVGEDRKVVALLFPT